MSANKHNNFMYSGKTLEDNAQTIKLKPSQVTGYQGSSSKGLSVKRSSNSPLIIISPSKARQASRGLGSQNASFKNLHKAYQVAVPDDLSRSNFIQTRLR